VKRLLESAEPHEQLSAVELWAGNFRGILKDHANVRTAFWICPATAVDEPFVPVGQELLVCTDTNYNICYMFRCVATVIHGIGLCCTIKRPLWFTSTLKWISTVYDSVHVDGAELVLKTSGLHWTHTRSHQLFAVIETSAAIAPLLSTRDLRPTVPSKPSGSTSAAASSSSASSAQPSVSSSSGAPATSERSVHDELEYDHAADLYSERVTADAEEICEDLVTNAELQVSLSAGPCPSSSSPSVRPLIFSTACVALSSYSHFLSLSLLIVIVTQCMLVADRMHRAIGAHVSPCLVQASSGGASSSAARAAEAPSVSPVAPPGSDLADLLAGVAYQPFEEDPRNFDHDLFRAHFAETAVPAEPPQRDVKASELEDLVTDVRTQFLANLDVLAKRHAAIADCPVGGVSPTDVADFKNRHISMVEHNGEVCLVHWSQFPCGTFGRPVALDHLNRIKTLVAMNFSVEDYSGAHLVHPNIGCWMGRWTQANRPAFPAHMLTLKRMWTVALRGQSRLAEASSSPMSDSIGFCRSCQNLQNLHEPLHDCPLCLFAWHPSCSDRVATKSDIQSVDGVAQNIVPAIFRQPADERFLCLGRQQHYAIDTSILWLLARSVVHSSP
jgi:hypothetical protein